MSTGARLLTRYLDNREEKKLRGLFALAAGSAAAAVLTGPGAVVFQAAGLSLGPAELFWKSRA
jgi:hypothetical protein